MFAPHISQEMRKGQKAEQNSASRLLVPHAGLASAIQGMGPPLPSPAGPSTLTPLKELCSSKTYLKYIYFPNINCG